MISPSGRLRRLALMDGKTVAASAESISYNARGQREAIRYGNGVATAYSYDPQTFYLVTQTTTGPLGAATRTLQQLRYAYDPVGNISSAEDATQNVVFTSNSQILPRADYAYDALYRLAWASGREQRGLYPAGRPQRPNNAPLVTSPSSPNDATALRSYAELYAYDDAGNLVTLRHTTPQHDGDFTMALAVDSASNRAVPDDRPPGSPQALDPRAAYDAAGDMLRLDHVQVIGWMRAAGSHRRRSSRAPATLPTPSTIATTAMVNACARCASARSAAGAHSAGDDLPGRLRGSAGL